VTDLNKPAQAVSATSGISYEDYSRLHAVSHAPRHPKHIPAWALEDSKVREVLIARPRAYSQAGGQRAPATATWQELEAAARTASTRTDNCFDKLQPA
jgi:hypothetical protein